jgi:hypothetical protein
MICRYRQIQVLTPWQLLERGPNRCGSSRILETIRGYPGTEVLIPDAAPGELLIVRIEGFRADPLVSTLYREPISTVVVDGYGYRLVPATAGDGLLVAMPATAGWSPDFGLDPPIRTLEVVGNSSDASPLIFQFEVIPIAP